MTPETVTTRLLRAAAASELTFDANRMPQFSLNGAPVDADCNATLWHLIRDKHLTFDSNANTSQVTVTASGEAVTS